MTTPNQKWKGFSVVFFILSRCVSVCSLCFYFVRIYTHLPARKLVTRAHFMITFSVQIYFHRVFIFYIIISHLYICLWNAILLWCIFLKINIENLAVYLTKFTCFYPNSIKQLTITYGFSMSSSSTHSYKQGLNQILKNVYTPFLFKYIYMYIVFHSTHWIDIHV